MDECGLLKGLERNSRACSLAQACGFDGASFHGDVFIGRVRSRPEPTRNASFELADMSSDVSWLRRAPADNAAWKMEMVRINEALEKNALRQQQARTEQPGGGGEEDDGDGDGAGDAPCLDDRERAFWWAQAGEELEVRVPLPEGVRAKELQVTLQVSQIACAIKGRAELLIRVAALHAPIWPDESTWEVQETDGSDAGSPGSRMLVLTLVKATDAHWPRLRSSS
mmetsp:Transcript_19456/g.45455  ORF Transcript_19456/g.45455 Transcript_19456/m.45455 type:complete len:225 (+) Transcript_19456:102-776(+)